MTSRTELRPLPGRGWLISIGIFFIAMGIAWNVEGAESEANEASTSVQSTVRPSNFLGYWKGTQHEPHGRLKTYRSELAIHEEKSGGVVGRYSLPDHGTCEYELSVWSASENAITLATRLIGNETRRCPRFGFARLLQGSGREVRAEIYDGSGRRRVGSAVLRQVERSSHLAPREQDSSAQHISVGSTRSTPFASDSQLGSGSDRLRAGERGRDQKSTVSANTSKEMLSLDDLGFEVAVADSNLRFVARGCVQNSERPVECRVDIVNRGVSGSNVRLEVHKLKCRPRLVDQQGERHCLRVRRMGSSWLERSVRFGLESGDTATFDVRSAGLDESGDRVALVFRLRAQRGRLGLWSPRVVELEEVPVVRPE